MSEKIRVLLLNGRESAESECDAILPVSRDRDFKRARTRSDYLALLDDGHYDFIVAAGAPEGLDEFSTLDLARRKQPGTPFTFLPDSSGEAMENPLRHTEARAPHTPAFAAGAVTNDNGEQGEPAPRRMEQLIGIVQELSLARSLPVVMDIVRRAARRLSGADGATFVLRDGDKCHYAEEDAISPLWKGQRFPMRNCISGWVMLNRKPAVIEDIYADARIPADAYRPTFVKSLVMVPIRTVEPIGAIGTYWASRNTPTPDTVKILQALADSTSIAMENVQLYSELEKRVQDRTAQLEAANRELESFSYAVSHDLRSPLQKVISFSEILGSRHGGTLDADATFCIERIIHSATRMSGIIQDLLRLSRVIRQELHKERVDLSRMAEEILGRLGEGHPDRRVAWRVEPGVTALGDAKLLEIALENLLGNAWKFSGRVPEALIEFGTRSNAGVRTYFVRDNGSGFRSDRADALFTPFQRLHSSSEFPGEGIGLSIVKRIVDRHGGTIRAEGEPNKGATFTFHLGEPAS